MKIKIFVKTDIVLLENDVNEFLQTVEKVIDIKYSSTNQYSEVMVIYEEKTAE